MPSRLRRLSSLFLCGCVVLALVVGDLVGGEETTTAPGSWITVSPRDEIRTTFAWLPKGGPNRQGSLVIEADQREGLYGWWEKKFSVTGGETYKVLRRTIRGQKRFF